MILPEDHRAELEQARATNMKRQKTNERERKAKQQQQNKTKRTADVYGLISIFICMGVSIYLSI